MICPTCSADQYVAAQPFGMLYPNCLTCRGVWCDAENFDALLHPRLEGGRRPHRGDAARRDAMAAFPD